MADPFLFQIGQLASKMFAAERSMLELCGGAAFGHVSDSFGPVATAISLSLISVWPVELRCSDLLTSMPSMCVRGLGRWLNDKVCFVE